MLGVMTTGAEGAANRLLAALAQDLAARGLRVVGAVQENTDRADGLPCDMDLRMLCGAGVVRISQRLGPGSSGCRMDADGVERAAGLAMAAFARGADLVIINKFGKQETLGGGFRQLIGTALGAGVPVLLAVAPMNRQGFEDFAEGMAQELPLDPGALRAWVAAQGVTIAP